MQCSYGVKASCGESPPPSRLGGLRRRLGGLKRLGGPKQRSALSPRRRLGDALRTLDIGAVEQPVEESGDGFGSYEIIDANIELAGSENYNVSVSDNPSLNKEGLASSESGICWDITADDSEESVHDNANIQNAPMLSEDRSRLLEKEYRNDILDDLLEVCFHHFEAFLF